MNEKLIKKYTDIINSGHIKESEIVSLKSALNRGKILEADLPSPYNLTIEPEQATKGIAWLVDQWKTPKGRIRKNNPFDEWECAVLEDFSHFTFVGFDAEFLNRYSSRPHYEPEYEVHSKPNTDGEHRFSYATWHGVPIVLSSSVGGY